MVRIQEKAKASSVSLPSNELPPANILQKLIDQSRPLSIFRQLVPRSVLFESALMLVNRKLRPSPFVPFCYPITWPGRCSIPSATQLVVASAICVLQGLGVRLAQEQCPCCCTAPCQVSMAVAIFTLCAKSRFLFLSVLGGDGSSSMSSR